MNVGQCVAAQNSFGRVAACSVIRFVKPDDGTCRTAIYHPAVGLSVPVVVNFDQVVVQLHQPGRRVGHAFSAGCAGDFASGLGCVAIGPTAAGDPQLVTECFKGKKSLRTDFNTVIAGGAFVGSDDRQTVFVEVDGVKGARRYAIAQAQTTPGAFLAPTTDDGGRAAGAQAGILRSCIGDVLAACTGKAGDARFDLASINAQIRSDFGMLSRGANSALSRNKGTRHDLLGEIAAAGLPTCAAVRFRQEVFDLLDARVFVNEKFAIGKSQRAGQEYSQHGHKNASNRNTACHLHQHSPDK